MNDILEFDAVLDALEGIDALSVNFPYDVQEVYGVRGQVKVKVTFDGVPYRGSLAKMGHHCHFLLVRKDIRKLIGKNAGDTVHVTVQRDTEERIVEVPAELAELFGQNPAAQAYYEKLSYTHRKEYVQWINEAKRPETRQKRLDRTIEMLLNNKKNPTDK
ncbi:MAG: YdeI/OmpD-associated family protein [Saprospiraceae bacterium]